MAEPGDPNANNSSFVEKLKDDAQVASMREMLIDISTKASLLAHTARRRTEVLKTFEAFALANPSLSFEELGKTEQAQALIACDLDLVRLEKSINTEALVNYAKEAAASWQPDTPVDPRTAGFDEFLDSYYDSMALTSEILKADSELVARVYALIEARKE